MNIVTSFSFLLALVTTVTGGPSSTVAPSPSNSSDAQRRTSTPAALPADCPKGSVAYERTKSCYWVVEKRMQWAEAERVCNQNGGKLASIVDDLENSFVFDIAVKANLPVKTVWLGKLKQSASQTGTYEWHDGRYGKLHEAMKEPANGVSNGGDCITMWMDMVQPETSWHRWDCNYKEGYAAMCNKPYRVIEPRGSGNASHAHNPLEDIYYTRRCCVSANCARKCASSERCIPDDLDCLLKTCNGTAALGWCLPRP